MNSMQTARERLNELTEQINRQLGTRCKVSLSARADCDGFVIDGTPADVRTYVDFLLSSGRGREVEFFNGDEDSDPDFRGWAYAHIAVE